MSASYRLYVGFVSQKTIKCERIDSIRHRSLHPPGSRVRQIHNAKHLFDGEGKTIKATQGGRFEPHEEIPRYLKLYASGALSVDDLITHRTTLDTLNESLDLLRAGKAARIVIEMTP